MNNLLFFHGENFDVVDRSTPRREEDKCACVSLIYFRGTRAARAAICTGIVGVGRRGSEGEFRATPHNTGNGDRCETENKKSAKSDTDVTS